MAPAHTRLSSWLIDCSIDLREKKNTRPSKRDERKYLPGARLQLKGVSPSSLLRAWSYGGRHSAGEVAESYTLIPGSRQREYWT